MLKYLIKRILRSVITLLIVVSAVFLLLRQMPVEGYFNNFEKLTPQQVQVGLTKLGLNRPVHEQLYRLIRQLLRGDLGKSNRVRIDYPISELVKQKMPVSFSVGIMAMAFALAAGLPLGILMARSARSKSRLKLTDRIGSAFVSLIQAVPASIYCLFIQIFGTELLNHFFRLPLLFKHENPLTWILPVFSLSLGNISLYALWMRRYMVDESNAEYALLARAKGLPSSVINFRHIFRNAVVPLIQYMPTTFILTMMGSLYVESRYSIPGMGGLLVDAIKRQDNTLVQALVLLYTILSIVAVLVGDVLMAAVDPRIRLAKGAQR